MLPQFAAHTFPAPHLNPYAHGRPSGRGQQRPLPSHHSQYDPLSANALSQQPSRSHRPFVAPSDSSGQFPAHALAREASRAASAAAEHFLRRKTPNGTLAAGYDGTPMDWTQEPYRANALALPQLPLPTIYQATPAELPRFDVGQTLQNNLTPGPAHLPGHLHPAPADDNGALQAREGSAAVNWIHPARYRPGIDSVLHQLPAHPALPYCQPNGPHVPIVLQPTFQASPGPTASNDEGPVGPYWPDGAFIPYRPAAMRDPRYYNASATTSYTDHVHALDAANQTHPSWQPAPDPLGPVHFRPDRASPFAARVPGTSFVDHHHIAPLPADVSGARWNAFGPRPGPVVAGPLAADFGLQPFTAESVVESHAARSGRASLSLPSGGAGQTPCVDLATEAAHAQVREQVLSWAHTVYVDLLASINQSSSKGSTGRSSQHQLPRASIYPRPPRQPALTFAPPSTDTSSPESGAAAAATSAEAPADQHACKRLKRQAVAPAPLVRGDSSARKSTTPLPLAWHASSSRRPSHAASAASAAAATLDPASSARPAASTPFSAIYPHPPDAVTNSRANAAAALENITRLCRDCGWQWVDGMLLAGCLAYGLGDYAKALRWHQKILEIDSTHVEAISNLAATLLALNRREEAEQYWLRSVKLRPSYFEAVEHLIGLLCGDQRGKEAVDIIEFVERSLRRRDPAEAFRARDRASDSGSETSRASSVAPSEASERLAFDYEHEDAVVAAGGDHHDPSLATQPGFGSSGFAVPGVENGRILALVHAKGNMQYALGQNAAAARAFEDAILIGAGRRRSGIQGLIRRVARAMAAEPSSASTPTEPILLPPEQALQTAARVFPAHGDLPGLRHVPAGLAKRAAVATMSNSLLSLAKILQDGMSSGSSGAPRPSTGVRDILALYYLSLALQPSPSTANNVGILLAGVQQMATPARAPAAPTSSQQQQQQQQQQQSQLPAIPGVVPGSGIALALAYYNYGLNLDNRHAHLYTNLGSLLKDLGQLTPAIRMYEQAVMCDGNFDIALANLANAVKDQGRVSDAIDYYRRAVAVSPDFAEAVCGLANALNSVCGWSGRGGVVAEDGRHERWHVDERGMLVDGRAGLGPTPGWIKRVVDMVERQLADGVSWGRGLFSDAYVHELVGRAELAEADGAWSAETRRAVERCLRAWAGQSWAGARLLRFVERLIKRLGWRWYHDRQAQAGPVRPERYARPSLPAALSVPTAPTVLPFHTFTCPLSAKHIRLISQRNGARISCSTLRAPWLPSTIHAPPSPPRPQLRVGYVSSDFNNHPLAHLMQSVFGFHDGRRVRAYCYATTASDRSSHRQQIEREAPVFHDASAWSAERLVRQIVQDGIHIVVNLNGYTRGARNDVFAARPAPLQMSFMGFAGTLGAEWCDYLVADETAIPAGTLRPWRQNASLLDLTRDENYGGAADDWVYSENVIFTRDTFFCCDHRQSAPDSQGRQLTWPEEQDRRWAMRKELFPELDDEVVIFGNFNQLYKIEPTTFRTWLGILSRLPKAVLWLLRFPDLGESNLKRTAQLWAGQEVASRIIFTDVAPKHQHISRARVCDLFLDTPECNAHTTAADVLWSGTPLLTYPRYEYKMCSRMASSILKGALPRTEAGRQAAKELIVASDEEYEERAVRLGASLRYGAGSRPGQAGGRLMELRQLLYESRWTSALFDTRRWVRDLEEAYEVAWRKWVAGEGGDIWL